MEVEKIRSLLYIWWYYYRTCEFPEMAEVMFNDILSRDCYPIAKIATYLHRKQEPCDVLMSSLLNGTYYYLLESIDTLAEEIFSSKEDVVKEYEKLMEELEFFNTLDHVVPYVCVFDTHGNVLTQ